MWWPRARRLLQFSLKIFLAYTWRTTLISMSCYVHEVLKTVIVLVDKGEQLLSQIPLASALKELAQPLTALVSLGLQACECGKNTCRMDFYDSRQSQPLAKWWSKPAWMERLSGKSAQVSESQIIWFSPQIGHFHNMNSPGNYCNMQKP